jgi:hypothetical protein
MVKGFPGLANAFDQGLNEKVIGVQLRKVDVFRSGCTAMSMACAQERE